MKLVSKLVYRYWMFEVLFVRASCFDTSIVTHNLLAIHLNGLPNLNPNTIFCKGCK